MSSLYRPGGPANEEDLPPNFQHCSLKGRPFTPTMDLSCHNKQGIDVWTTKGPRPYGSSGTLPRKYFKEVSINMSSLSYMLFYTEKFKANHLSTFQVPRSKRPPSPENYHHRQLNPSSSNNSNKLQHPQLLQSPKLPSVPRLQP